MADSFDFDSLPEAMQLRICASIASSGDLAEIHRFRSVSRTTDRLCEDPYVLRRASMYIHDYPWHRYPSYRYPDFDQMYWNYVQRCCDAGNTLAIYRLGMFQYFVEEGDAQREAQGLNLIARAAEEGLERAQKIYGVILISLGGEQKQRGFRMLSPFRIPLIPTKVIELESYWASRRRFLLWKGFRKMLHLKRSYVRENCSCNGLTSQYFSKDWSGWHRFERFEGMPTSMACEYCLWHEVLQIFFSFYDG